MPEQLIKNLISFDGEVYYYGQVIHPAKANHYFDRLLETIPWKNDEIKIFGKHIVTKRQVAWYGSKEYQYAYSGTIKSALLWTQELSELKTIVENLTSENYNSCLLNLYHNGDEGMGWHSDDEKSLVKNSAIASLSFGADRKFAFKHRSKKHDAQSLILEHGSLLLMKGNTQSNWVHSLPKSKKVWQPRINLTFRTMI